MRTASKHYGLAEALAADEPGCACEQTGCVHEQTQIARAQVHATLAIADRHRSAAERLIEEALHLRMYGDRTPGGNETWRDWDRRAEEFLRARMSISG